MKKKRTPPPEIVELKEEEYEQLLGRVERRDLDEQDWRLIETILKTFRFLQAMIRHKNIALWKFKEMLFGSKTEKEKKKKKDPPEGPSDGGTGVVAGESAPAAQPSSEAKDTAKPKAPGHGKRGALSWKGATVVNHPHATLKAGDPCPECPKGRVYEFAVPALLARVVGAPPLAMEVHRMERLRCNACGVPFTAMAPQEVRSYPDASPEACAITAILKYEAATPFYRLATVVGSMGVPLPVAKLWSMVVEAYTRALPVFKSLLKWAAQVPLFHADDTGAKILSLIKENEKLDPQKDRTGMQTTVIVAKTGDVREQAVLYFTGRRHAGENVSQLFSQRAADLPVPVYIRDGLSANSPKGIKTHNGGCNDHARRKFFEIRDHHPTSCGYVIEQYGLVYKADAEAKKQALDPDQRLAWHQVHSAPVMEELNTWCQRQLDERLVESNSDLGKAIKYFLKNYLELTLFLRLQGVPVSNAEAERAVKPQKLINKNALFYKNERGALVGDVLLSLILTCRRIGENAYEYFVALIRNRAHVEASPDRWLPWNFRIQLASSVA
jgi:transposase